MDKQRDDKRCVNTVSRKPTRAEKGWRVACTALVATLYLLQEQGCFLAERFCPVVPVAAHWIFS